MRPTSLQITIPPVASTHLLPPTKIESNKGTNIASQPTTVQRLAKLEAEQKQLTPQYNDAHGRNSGCSAGLSFMPHAMVGGGLLCTGVWGCIAGIIGVATETATVTIVGFSLGVPMFVVGGCLMAYSEYADHRDQVTIEKWNEIRTLISQLPQSSRKI
jgi:hypothetical protein